MGDNEDIDEEISDYAKNQIELRKLDQLNDLNLLTFNRDKYNEISSNVSTFKPELMEDIHLFVYNGGKYAAMNSVPIIEKDFETFQPRGNSKDEFYTSASETLLNGKKTLGISSCKNCFFSLLDFPSDDFRPRKRSNVPLDAISMDVDYHSLEQLDEELNFKKLESSDKMDILITPNEITTPQFPLNNVFEKKGMFRFKRKIRASLIF